MARHTGDTFRQICKALQQASAGAQVVYLCADSAVVEYAMRKALAIIEAYGVSTTTLQRQQRRIVFKDSGYIKFVTVVRAEDVRGLRSPSLITDGSVYQYPPCHVGVDLSSKLDLTAEHYIQIKKRP